MEVLPQGVSRDHEGENGEGPAGAKEMSPSALSRSVELERGLFLDCLVP